MNSPVLPTSMELLDLEVLNNLKAIDTDGSNELILSLIDIFEEEFAPSVKELESLSDQKNFDSLHFVAHRIKGACFNIGYRQLGQLFFAIETQAKLHHHQNIASQLEQAKGMYPVSKTALLEWLA